MIIYLEFSVELEWITERGIKRINEELKHIEAINSKHLNCSKLVGRTKTDHNAMDSLVKL